MPYTVLQPSNDGGALPDMLAFAQAFALLPGVTLQGGGFLIESNAGRLTSIRYSADKTPTNYVAPNAKLGDINLAFRNPGESWQTATTTGRATPNGTVGENLNVSSTFGQKGGRLVWQIRVKNVSDNPLEIGGLSTPLPMRTRFDRSSKSSVLKHSFVSGAGSFIFWMRPDSVGPYLTMTPLKGTALEYWSRAQGGTYQVFAHSASEVPKIRENKGSWRLPHTSRLLKPGETAEYGYVFEWSKDYQAVRDLLARNGKLDVQVAPGMTVPNDLFADVAFRSSVPIQGIQAEHPAQTDIKPVGSRGGYRIYRIRFRRLGENRLTVRQSGGAKTYLEFFSTQPVETLIKKRAAFIAKMQERDASKWYNGLLCEWNQQTGVRLTPDNYDQIKGWRIYEVTCDDPGLSKPAYLAAKNAEYPVQKEVDALDHYIDEFVWGGLQQTTQEKYPYGIYGIPDWKQNRESKAEDKTKGVDHVWRPYDYPHITLMYHGMYRIASQNPSIRTRLSAKEYLKRAYGTANAMFTVPRQVIKWSAYDTGFYNEIVIPKLIEDLRKNGMAKEASTLAAHWAKKVQTFASGKVDLFRSEYAFDSTGFESTAEFAAEAMRNGAALGIDRAKAKIFLEKQLAANLFCRGVIEPAYYYLGSDYRGGGGDGYTLSYMSPMGGYGVLDYALNYAKEPASYLRLGYQSILSSWALMNTGTAGSNYGYWFPGAANDGGTGGGFEPAAYGKTWLDQPHGRGSWYYSCETDLGYCGTLRVARTMVVDDPIFGRFCYGGVGQSTGSTYRFVPKDGVRRRVSIRTAKTALDAELNGVRMDGSSSAILDESKRELRLRIEPTGAPDASLSLSRDASVTLDGKRLSKAKNLRLGPSAKARWVTIRLP
ncbi:hypothetical protein EON82_14345 [bacterium]|nr:MAG: hypothetical protein EON82_14345 [bacterium]